MKKHTLAALALFALPSLTTFAATPTPSNSDQSPILSKVHKINEMVIDMAKLGKSKAQSKDVKSYAEHLIKDHKGADKEVRSCAKKNKFKLVDAPDNEETRAKHKFASEAKDQLASLKGGDFDRQFLTNMADDHDKAITLLNGNQTDSGPCSPLLAKILVSVKEHKESAEKLRAQIGAIDLPKP